MSKKAWWMFFVLIVILVSAAVVAYAQTVVVSVRGVPQIVNVLADQVTFLLEYKKSEINWDKTHVSNCPDGSTIILENDARMTKEDWITAADATIDNIQNRINAVNALK